MANFPGNSACELTHITPFMNLNRGSWPLERGLELITFSGKFAFDLRDNRGPAIGILGSHGLLLLDIVNQVGTFLLCRLRTTELVMRVPIPHRCRTGPQTPSTSSDTIPK